MIDVNDIRNSINSYFNPFHTLFIPYQFFKKLRFNKFFKTIEKNPLTKKQITSIILDEQRSLVVAGAGTGKTSTIIGKIGYILKNKACKKSEILVLAYNKSAAEELKSQLGENFLELLDANPLSDIIEIKYVAEFVSASSLLNERDNLNKYYQIDEVFYDRNLLSLIDTSFNKKYAF